MTLTSEQTNLIRKLDQNYTKLQNADQSWKGSSEFMLEVAQVNYKALEYASPELKADKNFALAAIRKSRNS